MRILLAVSAVVLLISCGPSTPPDTRAADEKAILAMEAEWSKAGGAKDLDKFVSYYADDASAFPPGEPVAHGKDAIRKALSPMFSAPSFDLAFKSTKVEVARSGELAYSSGTYTLTMNDPKGKPMNDRGKFVTVFRKQTDGSWKTVADIFNSDGPPPPPAPAAKPAGKKAPAKSKKARKR
jgi:uncharacterized protein (TIGR02246 family)